MRKAIMTTIVLASFASKAIAANDGFQGILDEMVCKRISAVIKNAENGDAVEQASLSKIYHSGQCGIPKSDSDALKWARLSAEKGNAAGEAMLAGILSLGWGVDKNEVDAIKWARLSANQGFMPGQDFLALMLHKGWGEPKNEKEAAKWARLTAEKGDAYGEALLAGILYEDSSVPQKEGEVNKWAKLSAQQKNGIGQIFLGILYKEGRGGLTQDYIEADKWFILASQDSETSSAGHTLSNSIELEMSPASIADAHRRVDSWRPQSLQK